MRFLAGFRWTEWQEQFTLQGATAGEISDFYQTNCFNDLYGGQIAFAGAKPANRPARGQNGVHGF